MIIRPLSGIPFGCPLMVYAMNSSTSVTLGDPEFPPKNGVIIKQGHLFVQETKRLLFVKWKVWRKRWICLRYLSNNSTPVLQIDSRNAVHSSTNLLNLSQESHIEMIDFSGQQDLATAKALQLTIDPLSEPLLFKHPSQTEMTDWMAAFRLTVALGETGSICSDTDSSIWNDSQTAASPVSSGSPNNPFLGTEVPSTYTVRINMAKPSPLADKLGVVLQQDYEVKMSAQDIIFQSGDGNHEIMPVEIPLHHIRKVFLENSSGNPDVVPTSDLVCIETTRHLAAGEGILKLETANPHDLTHHLRTLMAGPSNIKKMLADHQDRTSMKSRISRRARPVSERPRKRPISFMGTKGRFNPDQTSPVSGRAPRLTNRENSVRSMTGLRNFQHMDSRESEQSSGTSDAVSGASSLTKIAPHVEESGTRERHPSDRC